MSQAINALKNKGPNLWPWVIGAGVAIGGVKWVKDHRINVKHKNATPITRGKTKVDITGKRED